MSAVIAGRPMLKRKLSLITDETRMRKKQRSLSPDSDSESSYNGSDASDDELASSPRSRRASTTPITPATPRSRSSSTPYQRPLKYHCDFPACNKSFNRPTRLEEHKRSHSNSRIYKCPHTDCPKDFIRESHLKAHIKDKHTQIRDYICSRPDCGKAFSTGQRLRKHEETHDKPKKNAFFCTGYPPCNEQFRKHGMLQKHIDLVHLQRRALKCPQTNPETGEPCQASFEHQKYLKQHQALFHGRAVHQCPHCPGVGDDAGGFLTYNELQMHVRAAHPPFCDICGQVCTTDRDVRMHVEIHHERSLDERKNVVCPHKGCGKAFTKKGNLNVHVRTAHEKIKEFVCGETDLSTSMYMQGWESKNGCGQNFGAKQTLENHVRRHHLPGSTPKIAKKQKRERKANLSAVDKLTGSTPDIECVLAACGQKCSDKVELEIHALEAHGMSAAEVSEALAEQAALTGGKFWFGGGEGAEEEDDFTGLDREAVEINGANSGGLPYAFMHDVTGDELQDDHVAQMLSSFVEETSQRTEGVEPIDPAFLKE